MSRYNGGIHAVCISKEKGTAKDNTSHAKFIENYGLQGDAHAGTYHRQVSLLSKEKIDEFIKEYGSLKYGAFGENLVVSGIDFEQLHVGMILRCNDVILVITQFGKECHAKCAIYEKMGRCIMPIYGVFANVYKGGVISVGDSIYVDETINDIFTAGVITLSDRSAKGEREDLSGPKISSILTKSGYCVAEEVLIPDEPSLLKKSLLHLCQDKKVDLIVTTGGTGLSTRDFTPEVTLEISERNVPGIAEYIRQISLNKTREAILSRGVSVIRDKTLIINLPGSPKAVDEILPELLPILKHGIGILKGQKLDR